MAELIGRIQSGWRGARTRASDNWRLLKHGPFDVATPEGRAQERYRRAAMANVTSAINHVVGAVTGLIATPIAMGYLGKQSFGLWSAVNALMAWAILADFGLGKGIQNALGDAFGRDDWATARRYVATGVAILVGIAGLLAVVAFGTLWRLPWADWLNVDEPLLRDQVPWVLGAVAFNFLLGFPLGIGQTILTAAQRVHVWNLFQIAGGLLSATGLLLAVAFSLPLPLLVLCSASGRVVVQLCALIYAVHHDPRMRPSRHDIGRATARTLTAVAAPMLVLQIGSMLINQLPPLTIARRVDLRMVADYAVWVQVFGLPVSIISMLDAPMIPAFREGYARGDHAWLREAFRRLQSTKMTLAALGALFFVVFGDLITRALSAGNTSFSLSTWLASGFLLCVGVWNVSYNDILVATDRSWMLVRVLFANGIFTAVAVWAAAPYGVTAVILGTVAFSALVGTWLMPRLSRDILDSGPTSAVPPSAPTSQ